MTYWAFIFLLSPLSSLSLHPRLSVIASPLVVIASVSEAISPKVIPLNDEIASSFLLAMTCFVRLAMTGIVVIARYEYIERRHCEARSNLLGTCEIASSFLLAMTCSVPPRNDAFCSPHNGGNCRHRKVRGTSSIRHRKVRSNLLSTCEIASSFLLAMTIYRTTFIGVAFYPSNY